MKTFIVEGGIGKCVCFTALLPELKKKYGSLQIYTPYVDVFANNPNVDLVLDQLSISVFDPRIIESDKIYRDAYKGNFINGDRHLIEAMCNDYGIQYNINMKPELFTERYYEKIDEEYCIVQLSGGQPACNDFSKQYKSIDPGRNLHPIRAERLVADIKRKYPKIKIINFSLPNEPDIPKTEKKLRAFAWYYEALKNAKFHVSIDSCLNHFSGGVLKPGVVLWGTTKPRQYGYEHNINMEFSVPNYIFSHYVIDGLETLTKVHGR